MWTRHVSGVLLSIFLAATLIALLSFIMAITSQTASANPSSENFTIVALPDTQYYSQVWLWFFENQTEWIVQNENKMNIVFVTHLGDIINNYNEDYQWQNADNAMSILDNKVPYGILPGNHDIDGGYTGPPGAGGLYYENYFPASRYQGYPYWGGSYDSTSATSVDNSIGIHFIPSSPNMNNYQLFSAGGMNFIALSLQYDPPADVLAWADNVLSKYPNRRAIISTHAYLDWDGTRSFEGRGIWENLVVPHKNVFLVLCGHVIGYNGLGEAERIDNVGNRTVYQLLSDYQGLPGGGTGYLRIMKFAPSEDTIYVKTYSPYLDQYMTGSKSQFELFYPMNATAATSGGGISLMVYIGAIVIIVVIIAAVLATRQYKSQRSS
jgi:hypothetical protein